jgi:hypothetical protein
VPLEIEEKMTTFEKLLKRKQEHLSTRNKKNKLTNLSPIQHKVPTQLKQNKNIIIKPTDKNLGPAVLDTKTYIKQILQEHLLTTNYTQLTKETAKNSIENLKLLFKNLLHQHQTPCRKLKSHISNAAYEHTVECPSFMDFLKSIKLQSP